MIAGIVRASLRFRLLVVAAAAGLVLLGVSQLRSMPVDAVPEFRPPVVEVQTEALGLSAPEVESLVTTNLEELLNGTPHLQSIRSDSIPGLSALVLTFEPGTDVIRARQLVNERLALAYALPNVAKVPTILQPLSATNRVLMVGLTSRTVSPIDMSVLARWNVRPALLAVPGVANVAVWGQRERELQVQVDPERLAARNVTLDRVIDTAGNAMWVSPLSFLNASTPGTGGWVDTPQQRLEVRHVFPIATAGDLARVSVEGSRLKLGDVATVVEDHQPLIGDSILKDGPGLMLVVEKFPGANTLEVTRNVEAKLRELRAGLPGIAVDATVLRPATYVDRSVSNVQRALLAALCLVVLALLAVLWQWRAVVIAALAIPISLLAALVVLHARHQTMNAMVLAGLLLALAVVVDEAVAGVEAGARRLREARERGDERPPARTVLDASIEVRAPLVYGSLIAILPVLPVVLLRGATGSFYRPVAVAYALAVLAAMLVALTLTPALTLLLGVGAPVARRESQILARLGAGYDALLRGLLGARPGTFLAGGACVVGLAVAAVVATVPFGGRSLRPAFRDPNLVIHWRGAPGTSNPEMGRIMARAARELRALPGVRDVGGHVGRAILGDQVVDVDSASLFVDVDGARYDATVAAVRRVVAGYPGLDHDVRTYLADRTQTLATPRADDLDVRVYGPAFGQLRTQTQTVARALAGIPGVTLHTYLPRQEPHVQVDVDLARAEPYGLKPGDVRRAAATVVAGLEVGSIFEAQKVFAVVVRGTPATRESLTSIGNVLIDTPRGGHVRLRDVANVRIAATPDDIQHEGVSRLLDIGVTVQGRDVGAVAHDIERRLRDVPFALEYRAALVGGYDAERLASWRALGYGLAAAIGVLLLLQAASGSWRLAAALLMALPSAVVGAGVGALAAGRLVSLGSLAGFLAILGIAARSALLLVDRCARLELDGELPGPELVARAARERLRPTLATALAVAGAFLPFAVLGDVPGLEVGRQLAFTVLAGTVTWTAFTLLAAPALCASLRVSHGAQTVREATLADALAPGAGEARTT